MNRLALAATLVLLVAAAGCGSNSHSRAEPSTKSPASSRLRNLRDINQLRSLFNTRSGEPQLILLVSPT
jgi:hypothetical protein